MDGALSSVIKYDPSEPSGVKWKTIHEKAKLELAR